MSDKDSDKSKQDSGQKPKKPPVAMRTDKDKPFTSGGVKKEG